jgi:hypothetical protein
LGDLGIDGEIILTWILKKYVRIWDEFRWFRIESSGSFYECCFIKEAGNILTTGTTVSLPRRTPHHGVAYIGEYGLSAGKFRDSYGTKPHEGPSLCPDCYQNKPDRNKGIDYLLLQFYGHVQKVRMSGNPSSVQPKLTYE